MHTTRSLRLAVAVPALAAALTACSGSGTVTASGTAQPAGVSTTTATAAPTTAAATTTASAPAAPTTSACDKGGSIPSGAGKATTADLDGDGKKDQIWLADSGSTRKLGVKTASGAVFSTTFQSAAPQAATAIANRVNGDIPIILLNTGRSVQLYTVSDCKIVPTKNPQGQQYSFDLGFTGYGTGVGCPSGTLSGYLAKNTSGDKYTVTRTKITLSSGGTKASNGTTTTLGKGLSGSSSTVKTAQAVTCGSGGTAQEPQ